MAYHRLVPVAGPGPHHITDDPWTEITWAPVLGPSAMALWRQFGLLIASGYEPDAQTLGELVGLPSAEQRDKGLDRLVRFGIGWSPGAGILSLALAMPLPSARQRRVWPPILQAMAEEAGLVQPVAVAP